MTRADVEARRTISKAQATQYLLQDLINAERYVHLYVKVVLTQNQFNALVSFIFNLGPMRFKKSTLLKKINAHDFAAVPFEFSRWVYATDPKTGGKVRLRGLARRRADEAEMFMRSDLMTPITPDMRLGGYTPMPVREERDDLSESRTMRGSALSVAGTATSAIGSATYAIEPLTQRVSWLPQVLAGLVVVGIVAALIGAGIALYARRDDFRKAHRK